MKTDTLLKFWYFCGQIYGILHLYVEKNYYLVFVQPLFFLQQATAQVDSTIRNTPVRNPLIIEIEVENGGILASKEVKNTTFQSAYYNGVNLKVGWKIQKSDDQYFKLYNNPIYGIGFYSSTFNTEILGSPYAIYGFVQTPFGNLHNKKNGSSITA